MDVERGKVDGDVTVRGEYQLIGIINGSVTVLDGAQFYLTGIVVGDVLVEAGGYVEVNGIVNGAVHNGGGSAKIYGIVQRGVVGSLGSTYIDPKAVV